MHPLPTAYGFAPQMDRRVANTPRPTLGVLVANELGSAAQAPASPVLAPPEFVPTPLAIELENPGAAVAAGMLGAKPRPCGR